MLIMLDDRQHSALNELYLVGIITIFLIIHKSEMEKDFEDCT